MSLAINANVALWLLVTAFFLHFLLLDDTVDELVDWQVLELVGVVSLVPDQLEAVLKTVGDVVLLTVRQWRWWIDRVNRDSTAINKFSVTYFTAFSTMAGIKRARYGEESSRQGFVFTSISQGLRPSSNMKS